MAKTCVPFLRFQQRQHHKDLANAVQASFARCKTFKFQHSCPFHAVSEGYVCKHCQRDHGVRRKECIVLKKLHTNSGCEVSIQSYHVKTCMVLCEIMQAIAKQRHRLDHTGAPPIVHTTTITLRPMLAGNKRGRNEAVPTSVGASTTVISWRPDCAEGVGVGTMVIKTTDGDRGM